MRNYTYVNLPNARKNMGPMGIQRLPEQFSPLPRHQFRNSGVIENVERIGNIQVFLGGGGEALPNGGERRPPDITARALGALIGCP